LIIFGSFLFLLLEVELIDSVEGMIYVSSTTLSLLLLALSISAYRNTDLKKRKENKIRHSGICSIYCLFIL